MKALHPFAACRRWSLPVLALALMPLAAGAQSGFRNGFEHPASALACAGAPLLALASSVSDAIDPPGQIDYYRVNAGVGQWVEFRVIANPDNDAELLDSVLTVLAADGVQRVARNDDDVLGFGVDSALVYRSPGTATYCLQLQDFSSWTNDVAEGGPTYVYDLYANPIDFQTPGLNRDTEPNDTTATAQLGITAFSTPAVAQLANLAGDFATLEDVDVYRLNSAPTAQTIEVLFTPTGNAGYGGTTALGLVDIVAADGSTVLGRLDVARGARALRLPALGLTNYHVYVHAPPAAPGANPFYWLQWRALASRNPQETNDVANGVSATAEVATPVPFDGGTSYFLGGTIDSSDTDWWSFTASAGNRVQLSCASAREGSGVISLTVTLYRDPVQAPLQSEAETASVDLRWDDNGGTRPAVVIATTGTHYLRLTTPSVSGVVVDRHYNCGITVVQ